jgi:hypothetical protein
MQTAAQANRSGQLCCNSPDILKKYFEALEQVTLLIISNHAYQMGSTNPRIWKSLS